MRNSEDVVEIVQDYIAPKESASVYNLERIHKSVFKEDKQFSDIEEAVKHYKRREISDSEYDDFIGTSKRVIEDGNGMISETYFDIIEPESISLDDVKNTLSDTPYNRNQRGDRKEGFKFEVNEEKGSVSGRYIYVDVDHELSYTGNPQEDISEGSVEFEIFPNQNLLILRSTSVVKVQKTKGIFDRKTDLNIGVLGDLTTVDAETASEKMDDFKNSFADEDDDQDEVPRFIRVDDLNLHKPDPALQDEEQESDEEEDPDEVELTAIDFEGRAIAEHPRVVELIEDGWRIKKMVCKVQFQSEIFEVTVAGTSMMGYGKVAEFVSWSKGQELIPEVRNRFLENIA